MLTYKDILYTTTKIISEKFSCDVIVENKEGIYEGECFFISIIPTSSTASTRTTNQKQLIISVKYFSEDSINHYDVANKLELLFARNIKVKDRMLNISSIEPNFLEDEIGDMLDFLIYINYIDEIHIDKNTFDLMNEIDIKTK